MCLGMKLPAPNVYSSSSSAWLCMNNNYCSTVSHKPYVHTLEGWLGPGCLGDGNSLVLLLPIQTLLQEKNVPPSLRTLILQNIPEMKWTVEDKQKKKWRNDDETSIQQGTFILFYIEELRTQTSLWPPRYMYALTGWRKKKRRQYMYKHILTWDVWPLHQCP